MPRRLVQFFGPTGSITLTNGVAALRPRKGWTVAASICGAVEALTRALAVELAPIRVNAVCPGVVKTQLWSDMTESDHAAMYRDIGQKLPVGRVGKADDLAEAYLYLMRESYSHRSRDRRRWRHRAGLSVRALSVSR